MAKLAKLSVEVAAIVTAHVKGEEAHDKKNVKFTDTLRSEGITSDMLKAPAKGADSAFYDSFKVAVVAGFDAGKRKLLEMPTKGMSEAQKKAKREAQQSIGARIGNIRRLLEVSEKREGEDEDKGAKSTFEARLKRDLTKYIAQIEKLEGAKFPVVDMLKYLKSASVLIK
jgi:hypothetical protein